METKKILIVNPDTHSCDQLERILSQEGYLTYTAINCMEAGKLARVLKPNLSVISEKLSDGTGLMLAESILSHTPECRFFILSDTRKQKKQVPDHLKGLLLYMDESTKSETILKSVIHMTDNLDLRQTKTSTEESLLKRNRELEEINARLRQIVESTRRLTSFSGTRDIGPVILHEFAGSMNAEGGSLFLHKKNELVLAASLDAIHVPLRIPLPVDENSVISLVLSRNEPVLIEDINKHSFLKPSGWKGYTDKSLLAFPLLEKHGDIVGIITLHNKKNPPFTWQDKELGAILASYGSETLRATQAIDDLKQNEEKLQTILESNPDPMVVFDNEKRINYFNPAFTLVFGWTIDELKGRTIDHFIPENTLAETLAIKQLEAHGKSYSGIETKRYSKSGSIIPVSISGSVFRNDQGHVIGSVCNLRDITGQKNLEAQLVQSQKMEAIGTLASGIAHDFNNILSAIFGNVDLALMDLEKNAPSRHNIENISKAANRAKNLVGQILAFSRKTDKENEELQKIHPHLIIKEALFLLRASLPSTIEIKEKYLSKHGTIMAHPTRFHQIIMNLCTNAHHAMQKQGGTLSIELDQIKQKISETSETEAPFVKLTISDTGCGMDENTMIRIFDPYFTTKDKNLGTGLGLSVVRKIVDDFNGTISVYSRMGKGTRFEMVFPDTGGQVKREDAPAHIIETGTGNILFVDDEQDIANLSVSLLERLGYTVTALTNPQEALELVRQGESAFDIVITDMTMPKMTGIALSQELKKIRPDLPIVLCTGFNRSDISETIPENCVDAILKKPVSLNDFSQTLIALCKKPPKTESELHMPPSP